MARMFNNPVVVNNGVKLDGAFPIDDRFVLDSISDLYINAESPENCTLYGKIYKGAQLVAFDENGEAFGFILQDVSPYIQGHAQTVTADNFSTFWKSLDREVVLSTYYHVTDIDPTDSMLTPHGNLDNGTTAASLEQFTFSQILEKILFEFATPIKTKDAGVTIEFNPEIGTYSKIVEVGSPYPHVTDFVYHYTPETWDWFSRQDSSYHGTPKELSEFKSIRYMYNNKPSTEDGMPIDMIACCEDGQSCPYSGVLGIRCEEYCPFKRIYDDMRAVEGVNGWLYAQLEQNPGSYPVDSRDGDVDTEGNHYAELRSDMIKSNILTFMGGWRVYSNASAVYTDKEEAWSKRNENPSPFSGNEIKASTDLLCYQETHTLYFQWPKNTTDEEYFHIYCPNTYKIDQVRAASNVAQNVYDLPSSATLSVTRVEITNILGATGTFKDYTIKKNVGITNVEVVFKKA